MKVVLVTGGLGFIGSNFIRMLLEETSCEKVINFDKQTYAGNPENLADFESDPRYIFCKGDICDGELVSNLLSEHQPDAVVNFAAESHVDRSIDGPEPFVQTNVVGTLRLLEAFKAYHMVQNEDRQKSLRFLHVSTDEVYGSLGADDAAFSESTPYSPNSPYSASKAGADHLVRAYHHTFGLPVLTTNCSNNYGPYQFPEKLIPLMINNIKNKKSLPIYGKGENVRDWLWVVDHAIAIDLIYHEGVIGETYNIGGHNEWKNVDLVHLLCDVMDEKLHRPIGDSRKLITYVKDRAGHDMRYAIDASKIKNELGWEPSVTFEEGLRSTVDWYLSNEKWLDDVTSGAYQRYYKEYYSQ